jgi:hypothetical protein
VATPTGTSGSINTRERVGCGASRGEAPGSGQPQRPVRSVPGGWRDRWDDPDDSAELRARGEALKRWQTRLAEVLGVAWRQEFEQESPAARSGALSPS